MKKNISNQPDFEAISKRLCKPAPYQEMTLASKNNITMPSLHALKEAVDRLRAIFFPGYYGWPQIQAKSLPYHITASLDSTYRILQEQILFGIHFMNGQDESSYHDTHRLAEDKAAQFMEELPEIRDLLSSDVNAAYEGDPAAKTPGETIFCYPSILAMTNHRIAHCLYRLEVPLIPRIISEMAHSQTGIDIHPGAQIGSEFFIDHGTGVVIGETCIIGTHCRLYQGVTLGAVSFPKGEDGTLVKGKARHPILEDDVTVYAGATILGRVTIGHSSTIGGNVWLTESIEPNSRVLQQTIAPVKK